MQHLHDIEGDLFPKLLHLLFDPEKKGPSEFTTRGIVPSVLFAYIRSASPTERVSRAACVARHLRDPEPDEGRRPLPFVSDMHQERPYRVWNKEVVSVTKEVFWIFLHNLNVVSLPPQPTDSSFLGQNSSGSDYMERHFPHERPPVPAAPYVGGVEWDATNYLASHLDLMNAVLACTPSAQARNALRAQLRVSGFERCMGASLRLCKEKFYGAVHDGLRTWVAAAAEDCWPVKDVRFGPPPADTPQPPRGARSASPVKRSALDEPPKLEVPRLDFS